MGWSPERKPTNCSVWLREVIWSERARDSRHIHVSTTVHAPSPLTSDLSTPPLLQDVLTLCALVKNCSTLCKWTANFTSEKPIGLKNLSAALKRHHLECTQDRTDFRSDLTILNDLTVTTCKWCVENKLSLSHTLTVRVVNYIMQREVQHRLMT